jgi:dGTPase
MAGDFYGAFDRECLLDEWNGKRGEDYRSVFHQDRDRIMFSPAFRRLQTKTQVFQAGEYDFYRTRLTHSLEVSRIAESIAIWLRHGNPDVVIDLHLLEAICLAHDIGHPPFGHAGERVLNRLMADHGGFEGNAQTLRILTRTIYSQSGGRYGMSPTRALLDGVLKYKRLYEKGDENHFIYRDQAGILDFCFGLEFLQKPDAELKSIECQIMDLADDIAYSCFDIVDGWKARFLTPERLEARAGKAEEAERAHLVVLRDWMIANKLQPKINKLIGELIQSASLREKNEAITARTRRHAFELVTTDAAKAKIKVQKMLCRSLVYGSSALQQIEFKGGMILEKLAEMLFANYLGAKAKPVGLIPDDVHWIVLNQDDKSVRARLLCDHLSGMTDAYALRSYKRLLDPDYGSISELI